VTSPLTAPAGWLAAALPVRWRYHFTDFRTGRLLGTLPLAGVKLTEVLSGVGSADATLPLAPQVRVADPFSATVPRRSVLWAERQVLDEDERTVAGSQIMWGGPVMTRSRDLASRSMTIKAVSWEGYLARRLIGRDLPLPFSDTIGIARILLREAWEQTTVAERDDEDPYPVFSPHHAPMMTTDGPLSNVYVDRNYLASDLKPVLEAIQELANEGDGFDWHLQPFMATPGDLSSLQVRALLGYPRLGRNTPADLRWSTDRADARRRWGHIAELTLTEDGSGVNNRVTALGEGQPPEQLRSVANSYAERASGFPLYEDSLGSSSADNRTQSQVDGHAYGALSAQLASQLVVSGIKVRGDVTPTVDSYALGDDATLQIGEALTGQPVTIVGQVVGRTIEPGEPGRTETVTFDVHGSRAA
jgi:hypothetical protein